MTTAARVRTPKPRRADTTLRFGYMWPNSPTPAITSRQIADRNPDVLDVEVHRRLAETVEAVGVDFVFFADGYVGHGPHNIRVGHGDPALSAPIWAPVVMGATRHIGVVTTIHARYHSPVVIARLGANLDQVSGGRWGWNVVPGSRGAEADLFGVEVVEHDRRYEMVAETTRAVTALWASRGERVEFEGEFSRHSGVMRGPFPVQEPWPLLFNAGVSPAGQDFAAEYCDYVFLTVPEDLEDLRRPVEQLAARAEAHGRSPLEINMAASTGLVLGRSTAEAQEKYAWMREVIDMDAARAWARGLIGPSQTYQANYAGQDVDEVARKIGMSAGSAMLVGTAEEVAEQLIDVHRRTGVRGFMLSTPIWQPEEVALMADVLPIVGRAGLWIPPAERGYSW